MSDGDDQELMTVIMELQKNHKFIAYLEWSDMSSGFDDNSSKLITARRGLTKNWLELENPKYVTRMSEWVRYDN